MEKEKVRSLFKQIENEKVPPGLTAACLGEIVDETGQTGLHVCASYGHYPLLITNKDLANCWAIVDYNRCAISALHVAAAQGKLLPGTTAKELAACIDEDGFSALRMAALTGHLPPETTVHDLLADEMVGITGIKTTSLDVLADPKADAEDQTRMVLDNTRTTSATEMKMIGDILRKKNPTAVAMWIVKEMTNKTTGP